MSGLVPASLPACEGNVTVLVTARIIPGRLELLKSKFLAVLYSTRHKSLVFHDSFAALMSPELASNTDREGETARGPRIPAANAKAGHLKG